MTLKVWGQSELEEGGFGGILGVGHARPRGPRLVKVSYGARWGIPRHLALVGKGITFDSGGLSLKPPASMLGMKYDMTDAATVSRRDARSCRARAAGSGSPRGCVLPRTCRRGLRFGRVTFLRIYGGRTVEVLNTDAEGRLVLADGLVAASEEHPDAIIDVATLTGAQVTALGNRYVGTMGDDELVASTRARRRASASPLARCRCPPSCAPSSPPTSPTREREVGNTAGGALVAGQFLREFVPEREDGSPVPWVHLDIAGAAENKGAAYGATGSGPTGVIGPHAPSRCWRTWLRTGRPGRLRTRRGVGFQRRSGEGHRSRRRPAGRSCPRSRPVTRTGVPTTCQTSPSTS